MKLYTFLLIDDALIENKSLFKEHSNSRKSKEMTSYVRRNRIYTYIPNPDIALMSFQYPNINNTLAPDTVKYRWAYTLIDNTGDIVPRFLKQIWGTNIDKKGERIENITPIGSTRVQYIRTGGHIGNTNNKLHQYVYFGRNKNDFNPKKERIHHKGHSFDNRQRYLERVSVSKHRLIHNHWEPENNFFRPRKIYLGDSFSDSIHCDCENKGCLSCNAVMLIKTEEQLRDFIGELTGKEYKELERKTIYFGINTKK